MIVPAFDSWTSCISSIFSGDLARGWRQATYVSPCCHWGNWAWSRMAGSIRIHQGDGTPRVSANAWTEGRSGWPPPQVADVACLSRQDRSRVPAGQRNPGEHRVVALVRDPERAVTQQEGAWFQGSCHLFRDPVLQGIPENSCSPGPVLVPERGSRREAEAFLVEDREVLVLRPGR